MNKQSADHVFLDYDQARLDLNYNQSAWAPNAGEIIAWYRSASLAAHERLAAKRLAYGEGALERIDLFSAGRPDAPLVVYVHGGAWLTLDRMDTAFAAEAFVAAGVNFAALEFAAIPKVRLPDMVRQVQRAIGWLSDHADELGFDGTRLFAIGHSSGAHLVAAALTADTPDRNATGKVRAALCISGSYDLEAPMLSARGAYLQLSDEEVDGFSPVRHLARVGCPVIVACGDGETDEFRRHSMSLHAGLRAVGKTGEMLVAEGQNHFEISQTLADRNGLLFQAAMQMIAGTD